MGSFEILRGWETGQIAAILNKVSGGDRKKLEAILQDEVEVNLVERVLKLADKNGRIIPSKDLENAARDPNKNFHLIQPQFKIIDDYAGRLVRFQESFKEGPVMSAADFEGRSNQLIAEIKNNKNLANLLNGVYLPIILPRVPSFTDYGETLEKVFLPAVKFSYEKQFPDRKFYNYRKNELSGKIIIVSGVRHDKLIERIKHDFLVAIYFPNPFQGFSVSASREQMATFPESLVLSGGFDTASAMAIYPDVLARDWNTPGYDLSTLAWQSPGYSLYFEAYDDRLYFYDRGYLGFAFGDYSSGLLFLGSA